METRTAGDPDDPEIVFTDLTPVQLEQQLETLGTPAGDDAIRDWMDDHELRLRKISKVKAGGESPDRDTQFQNIAPLIQQYQHAENPYFSVDTKAKEFQGELFRAGRIRGTKPFLAFDHDFPRWADGVLIPHGIYDPQRNRGHSNIGLSHDTTQFACDSLRWDWKRIGCQSYTAAHALLLLVDCGGSNAASKDLFKHDLQQVVNEIGIPIRVAHFPSYCSKYNPLERRFFPHVSRACTGMLFDTLDRVVSLLRKAVTSTGLKTTVNVLRRVYETGRAATKQAMTSTVTFHVILPKWNYTLTPQIGQ